MQYGRLGRSGLKISRLVLGSSTFGEITPEDDARQILHAAWEAGINAIDTGDIYGNGQAEEIIGRAVQGRRHRLVILTKVGNRVGDAPADHAASMSGRLDHAERWSRGISPNDQGLSRAHVVSAVEASLRRLRTDYIDVYQVHRWDPEVPIEETLRALDDLVRAGKVRYIGCSNLAGWQLHKALWTSDVRALVRYESVQVLYNLFAQGPEQDILAAAANEQVGALVFSALASGFLSGKHGRQAPNPGSLLASRAIYQQMYWNERNFARLERWTEYATRTGRTCTQLALGWVLSHPAVSAALVGVQYPHELEELTATVSKPLTLVERTWAAQPDAAFPD
ncbi:MAG: aldo/keto reductase [Steroidobacteraceae bacterium]